MKKQMVSAAVTITSVLFVGCARLDYVKVPSPTQYSQWTDEQQRKADAMKGVRYYLPRPFVHLKQSVPVAQRVALITFTFDDQSGDYLLELPPEAPAWLRRVAPKKMSVTQALAANVVAAADQSKKAGNLQASKLDGDTNSPAASTPTPESPAQTMTASTGYINETDPVTKLSALMDVVYLPDFEEQYVIQPHVGFAGQAEIETKLRNGWAAETFKQKIDYSQVAPYIIRNIEKASDTAAKIATTWLPTATLGLPPNTSLADMMKFTTKGPGGLQSARLNAQDAKEFLSKSLIFKIAEVRVAQPGIYPILKEREMKRLLRGSERQGAILDPDVEFETFLQQANVPWIRPDMAFVPCPPVTVVGFNTTIDIFLTPATDRINVGVNANSGSEKGKDESERDATAKKLAEEFQQKIKAALIAALKTSEKDELKAVSEQNMVVESQSNRTKITIAATGGKPFRKADILEYGKAIKAALNMNEVDVNEPQGDTFDTLQATVNTPASAIVGKLPKR